jgi:hypothetical protein
MDSSPYEIKNQEIALALEERGFAILEQLSDNWQVVPPEHFSATKAKKIISTVIQLYSAAKEMSRAQSRYAKLLSDLEYLER